MTVQEHKSTIRELFNIPESRAKNPMTLEGHIAAYRELVNSIPRDGSLRTIAEYLSGDLQDQQYLLPHYIQAERDIRRLALHRVQEAIGDLTKEELMEFVVYLIEQSKRRQEDEEEKLNRLIGHAKKLSKDDGWIRSIAQLNKLRLLFADSVEERVRCWCCQNQPVPMFDPHLGRMWMVRRIKRMLGIRHR